MPGNPEECRRHALECVRLAQATAVPQRREYFAKLARTWIELAEELRETVNRWMKTSPRSERVRP